MKSAMQIRKHEIALMLAARYGYTSYLEICTSITGGTFSLVDKKQFPRRARLMYKCPPDFGDGEPIDFSTEAESGEELLANLMRSGEKFDLVFIDPWHTYTSSLRDIVFGLHLIKDDGVLLIHDCNAPNAACAEQGFHSGPWCGVTFAAYLDIVLFTGGIHYVTVDTDYGCGIISKDHRLADLFGSWRDASLASPWRELDLSEKYAFFDENRSRLLHLISTDEFCRRLGREFWKWAEQAESGEDEDVTECDRDSAQTPISTLDAKEHSQRSSENQP